MRARGGQCTRTPRLVSADPPRESPTLAWSSLPSFRMRKPETAAMLGSASKPSRTSSATAFSPDLALLKMAMAARVSRGGRAGMPTAVDPSSELVQERLRVGRRWIGAQKRGTEGRAVVYVVGGEREERTRPEWSTVGLRQTA